MSTFDKSELRKHIIRVAIMARQVVFLAAALFLMWTVAILNQERSCRLSFGAIEEYGVLADVCKNRSIAYRLAK